MHTGIHTHVGGGPLPYRYNPHQYHPPQPNPDSRYTSPPSSNPWSENPKLSRGAKIAIGGVAVLGVGAIAYLIFAPKKAAAAELPPLTPTTGGSGKRPGSSRPAGHPPPYKRECYPAKNGGSSRYDVAFWDEGGTDQARLRIFETFEIFGYKTPDDRMTMNDPGPDAALGGGDDVPNQEVKRFQRDYNTVSRDGNFLANMGGLDEDGYVGPCTLNALKYILDNIGDRSWTDVVDAAR